jgi:hypothetical protein
VDVAPEHELAEELLPRGGRPLLGLSVIPTPAMADCLGQEAARVRALLEEFRAFAIVPVVSTMHRAVAQEEDATAIAAFAEMLLPGQPILAPQLLERPFWRSRLTPRRLKGIIARCDVLVTQRKHNAIHGIGVGVRTIGLHPLLDDSLRRTFVALGHRLPPGSRCVGLDGPAEAPA